MRVLVQLRSSPAAHAAALAETVEPSLTAGITASIPGLTIDQDYPAVQLPGLRTTSGAPFHSFQQSLTFSLTPNASTYLVRGQIPDGPTQPGIIASLLAHQDISGIFADPLIESCITCGGTPPVGDAAAVATLLDVNALKQRGFDGSNVPLAIVDTGINLDYLHTIGRQPTLDQENSWTPKGVLTKPGNHPLNHGTMCAFDAGIAAPRAQLLDYAVLLSQRPGATQMSGLLSDAVLGYSRLLRIFDAMPQASRAMVVSNSWGMFSSDSDFPPGSPGNYSDNPEHPFNIIVATLEAAGADILFAAGNCGRDCPDGRCSFGNMLPICGANSHPSVLSIAGADTNKQRVGYSSQGPGRLTAQKPDITSFTHFDGSRVFSPEPDSGTSAACPVAAGVVAAIRSKVPAAAVSPAQLRALIAKTAEAHGAPGFDNDYGFGVLNVSALIAGLQ
jgi:subtilisin family serine protease